MTGSLSSQKHLNLAGRNFSPTAVQEREAAHEKNLHGAGKGACCIQSEWDRPWLGDELAQV